MVVDITNYDGSKGYIGDTRFRVFNLDGIKYLVSESLVGTGLSDNFEAYELLVDQPRLDSATGRRVEDKNTLVKLANEVDEFAKSF